ncbi:MAG: ABC transporter ATP-binding protein [Eubacteriaceae bacterium]|nr:ABC transporter ATP-binding protein [Eubacteriaceae bacterium]
MNIETRDVSITLSHKEIVKNASLKVQEKEFVGLLGPNGSGKTTLLKSIYRVLKPSNGVILIDGEDIKTMSYRDTARRMGVVSQFNNLSFDFTVEEMVLMGRAPHKKAFDRDTEEDYRIAEDALRRVDMLDFRDRSFLTLSGGERQRIILARALAQQVEIMILDEPTNHLDIKYQIQIMDVVKSLGVGVLAALHDLNLTLMYCTYVYVLKDGRIVAEGPTEQIITEKLINDVYEVECSVARNPKSGKLNVTFFSKV